ncbi:hypothetical protein SSYRP_v1c01600 [Spiroplasma syrphidicola EA-1]|uniref:Folate family ECF transporter S component n=1 Tax=Spiroplasma syrphidicola EA-1 TaxID=1276229 RepID=R4UKG1_9MOLU|nr:folate family ECF transporter S component [Spiroplasma syrphidicola]AGM25756.1 hypothetical protein SSYRP_v1c01600 [Spiroplasma syrphidicola EA-1]
MLYLLTNIGAWLGIALLMGLAVWMDYKNIKQISILAITLTSFLVALSVLLTNLISYSVPFFGFGGIRLALGNFLIFVVGMLFGPFLGVLSGIATDLLGSMINIAGSYHGGFTLNLVLYGFVGSLAFLFQAKKLWYLNAIIFYTLTFMVISFGLNTLWLYSIGWNSVVVGSAFIVKLIKFPIEMLIYIPLALGTFSLLYKLITAKNNMLLWCTKHGELYFKRTRDNKYPIVN